jgi:hypothetical protein
LLALLMTSLANQKDPHDAMAARHGACTSDS